LLLKGVLTDKDWDQIKEKIQYKYAQDQYFEEMKSAENYRNRIDLLNQMQPYIGTYFSQKFIMKDILRFTDKDIVMMKEQMESEPQPQPMGVPGQPQQPQDQSQGQPDGGQQQ
jgi:hypothetical protein